MTPSTRVGLRPSALDRGKDSPSSGTLLSPSGLKVPESLIECRVTSRVQSELLELASRKVGAFAPGPGAALLEGRAVTWNCVAATPKPAGYAGGWRRVPGNAPAHVLGPSQPQPPCVSGPWRGEEGRLQHQADPFGSGAFPDRTFSRIWTSNRARWAHFALLPAVGWCWCCPGREAVSLVPKIIGFSLSRSGSCEKRGGRLRAEPVVVAHLLLWTRGPADTSNPVSHQPFLAPPACPPCEFARIPILTVVSWDEEPISPGTL